MCRFPRPECISVATKVGTCAEGTSSTGQYQYNHRVILVTLTITLTQPFANSCIKRIHCVRSVEGDQPDAFIDVQR